MKPKVRITLVGIVLLVAALPIAAQRTRVKSGVEVGNRVRQLQKYNTKVRAALNIFEANAKRHGNNNVPKLDQAVSITQDPARGTAALSGASAPMSPFRKAGFRPQDTTDYSAYGVEMIFIPSYVTDTERVRRSL